MEVDKDREPESRHGVDRSDLVPNVGLVSDSISSLHGQDSAVSAVSGHPQRGPDSREDHRDQPVGISKLTDTRLPGKGRESELDPSRHPERGRDSEIGLSRHPERGRDTEIGLSRHPERGRATELGLPRHPERGRGYELGLSRHPERGRDADCSFSRHPERDRELGFDFSRYPERDRDFGYGFSRHEHPVPLPPLPRRFPTPPQGFYDYGEVPQSQGSFSSAQLAYLDRMQNQQMKSLEDMLQRTLGGRKRSGSRKRQRSPSPSDDQEEDSESDQEESPSSNTTTPTRSKYVDAVSLHAGESNFGDVAEDSAEKQGASDIPKVQDPEGSKKEDSGLSLPNPHEVKKGYVFKEELLTWWEQQRTNVLTQDQIDQMVGDLKPDSSIEKYFQAPNLPPTLKKNVRKMKAEVAKNDNSLWSIQQNMLQASLPLLKEMETAKSSGNEDLLRSLSNVGTMLGSALQRLSVYRLKRTDPILKDGVLSDASPSMTCIYGDKWVEKVDEDEKLQKVTMKVVKGAQGPQGGQKQKKQFKRGFKKGFRKNQQTQNLAKFGNRSSAFPNNRDASFRAPSTATNPGTSTLNPQVKSFRDNYKKGPKN